MNNINIYTDGAVPSNQYGGNRKGGIGVFFGENDPRNISYSIKEDKMTKVTNQVCELTACLMALESINQTFNRNNITIYTDSMYVVNSMTLWAKKWKINNWKKSNNTLILNKELIEKLYNLTLKLNVNYQHVKAHTNKPSDKNLFVHWYGNMMADKLAVEASKI
jgi:ribonuclease HI